MVKAINIKWDVDEELLSELPTEVPIPPSIEEQIDETDPYHEEISDYLTDHVGFYHNGFELVETNEIYHEEDDK